MELRRYFGILRKWFWLFIVTAAVAMVSSYFFSRNLTPQYRASTTVLVGRIVDTPNPYVDPSQTERSFAQAYALLVTQPPILQATADALQWPESWQTLYFKISAATISSQLLQITVTDTDPKRAAAIANELANQLILQGPISSQQKQSEEQRNFVTAQLAQLKLQIESSQRNLTTLSNQLALENDPKKQDDLNARVAALQTKITDAQRNYANLSTIISNSSSLFLTVLAIAQPPSTPFSPNITQNVLLAGIAGLVLAAAAIFILEYLDDTIKEPEDVTRSLNLSTLGVILRIAGIQKPGDQLVVLKHPRSPISEAYRMLRTNLRFSNIGNSANVILVTSSNPGEGKTTTAANLGIIFAQAGGRVVLVDADMRRPSLHRPFGLSNGVGLSSLFLGDAPTLQSIIQPTPVDNLQVITSGPIPPNPAEVLDSGLMKKIVAELRSQYDMVIIDSPPVLAVADATILGTLVAGAVLVAEQGHTRTDTARHAVAMLHQTGTKVLGVVLNKQSSRRGSGSYYYYYYYSSSERGEKAPTTSPS
jgi:non-specific protein-tyrosine kinase